MFSDSFSRSGAGSDPRHGGPVLNQQREEFGYLVICSSNSGLKG